MLISYYLLSLFRGLRTRLEELFNNNFMIFKDLKENKEIFKANNQFLYIIFFFSLSLLTNL